MTSETKKTDAGKTVDVHEMVTNGLHAMVLALGYKAGILDSFRKINKSCTAEDISEDAKLKLRYVREWLGCMTASGVVKMDGENRYFLQNPESVYSAAQGACVLPVLGELFPRLQNVMPTEGPSGYTFPESFADWLDMVNSPYVNADWVENNIKDVTDLIEDQNLQILDFGCGYGKFALEFSKSFRNATVWGVDIDKTAIEKSDVLRQKHNRDNLSFLLADGENLPDQWTSKFDLIVMLEVLHDLPDPVPVLKEIRRVLHPEGYVIAIDPAVHSEHKDNIGLASAKCVMPYSMFVCLPMSMSKQPAVGHGIGWGYEKRKIFIEENGFNVVKIGNEDINTLNNRIVFRKNSV